MPCCAFAAVLVGQILVALGAVQALFFGRAAVGAAANPAVEWRPGLTAGALPAVKPPWRPRRFGLALAAAIELALVIAAVYGVATHSGHGAAFHGAGAASHLHESSPLHAHDPRTQENEVSP
jgi:hypothetical protein